MKFNLFGFPIEIHWSFFVVALFLAGNLPSPALVLYGAVVILFSVLVHEMGHAMAARSFGMSPAIRLYYFGGLTAWRQTRVLLPRQRLMITLAGPGAGFLLAALIYFGIPTDPSWPVTLRVLVGVALYVNIIWGILNLLPMLPLDGGQALGEILTILRGRSDRVLLHRISTVTGALLAAFALTRGQFYLGILAGYMAYTNYVAARNLQGPYGAGGWR